MHDVDSLGMASVLLSTSVTETTSYLDAMDSNNVEEWMKTTNTEWELRKAQKVFNWVDPPPGANVI